MKTLLLTALFSLTSLAYAADAPMVNPHGSSPHGAVASAAEVGDVNVAKAVGANAYTVAEIIDQSKILKDKPAVVRGKVVKFSPEIMGKNWIHLRDGSGTAAAKNNDLVLTTKDQAKVGAVVIARGIVRTDKDFGHGYAYEVIMEEASVSAK
jgi:hypothetical protein